MERLRTSRLAGPGLGFERHFTGRFTERVCSELAKGIVVEDANNQKLHMAVTRIQVGPNPLQEEVIVRFQLAPTPVESQPDIWDEPSALVISVDEKRERAATVHFVFTFRADATIEENLSALREFIRRHQDTAASIPDIGSKL